MSRTELPAGASPAYGARSGLPGAARVVLSVGCAIAAIALARESILIRGVETKVAAELTRFLLHRRTFSPRLAHDVLLFQASHGWVGIRVTPKCTVVVLFIPVLLAVSVFLWGRRIHAWRALTAGLTAAATMAAVNTLRLVAVIGAYSYGGESAFEWMHVVIGTALSLIGTALAVFLFIRILLGRTTRRQAGAT